MSAGTIIAIVIILVLMAVAAATASMMIMRRAAERRVLGPEYDRLAREVGPRKANAEFAKRRQRVDGLGITPLSDERRAAYTTQWEAVQAQFVDSPAQTVRAARAMITAVAVDRGYEVTDHDQLLTDLSVYHGRHLEGYRRAGQTTQQAEKASTENLRQALLGYRHLLLDLIGPSGKWSAGPAGVPSAAAGRKSVLSAQRPWKQVTQGQHWKTRRQEDNDMAAPRP